MSYHFLFNSLCTAVECTPQRESVQQWSPLTSGQGAANEMGEMGYNFKKSQKLIKTSKKDGLESNNFHLIIMNWNLRYAHIARRSRRKMR